MKTNRIDALVEGMLFSEEMIVRNSDLDSYWHIGQLDVLATPILIAFVEQTIVKFLTQLEGPLFDTICLETNMKHIKPAHEGEKIRCNIYLKYIDEDKLFFDAAVLNYNKEEIAIGAQERQIV
ncbi:MAG: hypothetical protein JW717_13535 [Marinilabiliaceae bacterium]|nr:hypothetical protein [Marinilabiliaceae bacterium]